MAAPLPKRDDRRRETILEIARDVFMMQGFAATSMSAIATRLGGSKGTLYNYFKSKEELFGAVVARECAGLAASLFENVPPDGEMRQRLTHFGRVILSRLLEDGPIRLQRIIVAETERFPEIGAAFYESGHRQIQDRLSAYMAADIAAGRLSEADPHVAAAQFKDLVLSNIHQQKLWGVLGDFTDEHLEAHVDRAVETFLKAYTP
ncbi:TetR/AcrR family transcriptional regulator [Phenylobacterium sp.]|uniref:TetR/AcrR family transcriptional regulator n=1 Tax=Phenylobacterium sp. TaxID=1871053 RepID=UPI0035B1BC28